MLKVLINPQVMKDKELIKAAMGAAPTIHTQLTVSRSAIRLMPKYRPTATPTASTAQTNWRMGRPKKIVSL